MAAGVADVVLHLLLHRQGEERFCRRADAGDQFRGNAVAGDIEKTDLPRRFADGVGDGLALCQTVAGQIADIDGR